MTRIINTNTVTIKNIRLRAVRNLIFFLIPVLFSCNSRETGIHIIKDGQRAKAVSIPRNLAADIADDSIGTVVQVKLKSGHPSVAIFGKYIHNNDSIVFEPYIPFTPGLEYEVFVGNKQAGSFKIPAGNIADAPTVLAVYPSPDTLPENLLKVYIRFSQPMQEARSAQHIVLIKNNKDTLTNVFLDLQPELWNDTRTVLTVWLDPGRIKRDLQPNLRLGNPLQEKNKYTLLVTNGWKGANGISLQKDFTKQFVASKRDSLSPVPHNWDLEIPKTNTKDEFKIDLKEPLDHFLLEESLQVVTDKNIPVKGKWVIDKDDRHCAFIPTETWSAGNYILVIASRLEDLAGNNLNRPFDRDITKTKTPPVTATYRRNFVIGD